MSHKTMHTQQMDRIPSHCIFLLSFKPRTDLDRSPYCFLRWEMYVFLEWCLTRYLRLHWTLERWINSNFFHPFLPSELISSRGEWLRENYSGFFFYLRQIVEKTTNRNVFAYFVLLCRTVRVLHRFLRDSNN